MWLVPLFPRYFLHSRMKYSENQQLTLNRLTMLDKLHIEA